MIAKALSGYLDDTLDRHKLVLVVLGLDKELRRLSYVDRVMPLLENTTLKG